MLGEVVGYLGNPGVWLSFLTLSLLEIVLGIDNVIFVAIVANRLPEPARTAARSMGIVLAFFMRVAFLATVVWLVALRKPIHNFGGFELTWHDLILAGGGLFLLYKPSSRLVPSCAAKPCKSGRPRRLRSGSSSFRSCYWISFSRSIRSSRRLVCHGNCR